MNAMVMLLLGAAVGGGIALLLSSLRPVPMPVHEALVAVEAEGHGYAAATHPSPTSLRAVLARAGARVALGLGDEAELRNDLAVTGSTIEQHGLIKAAAPALAVVIVYVCWLGLVVAGVAASPIWVTVIALLAIGVAFVAPDARLRARARQARIAFRHALSAYLDLVTVIMSGGGGLLTALQRAADAGDGWAFAEIRSALDRARLSNRTPWSQLGVLGERFDIPELRDLVAAAELAGSEGARIGESVATKSDVLRARLQAEVERSSESLTEQMLIPVGLLLVALFLFLGFAVFQQLGGAP